jgi:hypothetical protein
MHGIRSIEPGSRIKRKDAKALSFPDQDLNEATLALLSSLGSAASHLGVFAIQS